MIRFRSGTRHALLREATAEVHDNLEALIEGRAYLTAVPSYGQYIQRLHCFHQSFRAAFTSDLKDLADVWRLEDHEIWLKADLDDLGVLALSKHGTQRSSPRIDCRASAFGAAYVLFGSALGARVLLERARCLALPNGGTTYLSSLAHKSSWPQFLAGLESEPDLPEAELLRGALETFASFESHMTGSILQ